MLPPAPSLPGPVLQPTVAWEPALARGCQPLAPSMVLGPFPRVLGLCRALTRPVLPAPLRASPEHHGSVCGRVLPSCRHPLAGFMLAPVPLAARPLLAVAVRRPHTAALCHHTGQGCIGAAGVRAPGGVWCPPALHSPSLVKRHGRGQALAASQEAAASFVLAQAGGSPGGAAVAQPRVPWCWPGLGQVGSGLVLRVMGLGVMAQLHGTVLEAATGSAGDAGGRDGQEMLIFYCCFVFGVELACSFL